MNKNKQNIFSRFMHLFTNHPWLKLIALALAIALWFYVKGEKS
ncbi:MAG: hypothetical protein WC572_03740 [Candidatus Omnitrophota bacterium]|nr:hypothetical protein [Candidatus Omnitrophota bacterium]